MSKKEKEELLLKAKAKPEEVIKEYSKKMLKEALTNGIARLDLLSSLIIEPDETVKKYLPDLEKDAREKSEELTKEYLSSLDKETLKKYQKDLDLRNEQIEAIQKLTPEKPLSKEDAIRTYLEKLTFAFFEKLPFEWAEIKPQLLKLAITELKDEFYNDVIEEAEKRTRKITDGLKEMEKKSYGWVEKWSKLLFGFGLGIVGFAVFLSIYGVYTFYNTFYQLTNYIAIAALIATYTSLPAIFTSLPAIFTSIPWQQIIAASGVLAGTGLTSIITTFIKGSFQEVKDCSVDKLQVKLLSDTYINQIKNLIRVITRDLVGIENIWKEPDVIREKKVNQAFDAIIKFVNEETKLLKELIKELQNYLQTPIKTEESKEEESKRLTALLKELIK